MNTPSYYKDVQRMATGSAKSSQSILVVGSGRSGTTWISSVLAECRDAVQIFEPLNQRRVPEVAHYALSPDSDEACCCPGVYLRPAGDHAEWQAFMQQLFAGRIANCWTRLDSMHVPRVAEFHPLARKISYFLSRKRYEKRAARSRFQIIKMIRANLMIGWLAHEFPSRMIFVIRHPCAVVASRLGHRWSDSLAGILNQPLLIDDYLQPMRRWFDLAESELDRHTILWCVENLIPLMQQRPVGMSMHWYESFQRNPEHEFNQLFESTGLEPTASAERAMHRFYSNSSDAVRRGEREWHAGLGDQQGRRVLEICNAFGLRMYGAECDPLVASDDLDYSSAATLLASGSRSSP